jgi:hypothetical protein
VATATEHNTGETEMGMCVCGREPNSEVGDAFFRNIWDWQLLWGYCVSVSPEAASLGKFGFSNDGKGLNAAHAKKLAAILRDELASGATREAIRKVEQFEVAPETGWGAEFVALLSKHGINAETPPTRFTEQDVREFAEFLEHSGGFSIW